MDAQIVVDHSTLNRELLKARLDQHFQGEDRAALKESPRFQSNRFDSVVIYATRRPGYRIICVPLSTEQLQIYVEPTSSNIVQTCASIWEGLKTALAPSSPRLNSLTLQENDREFLSGKTTTYRAEFRRKETLGPIIIGVAAAAYAIVGAFTFASDTPEKFLAGAITGILGAFVAVWFAVVASRAGKLIWEGRTQ